MPGSGKSTLALGLAEKLRFPVFSVDPIESSIIKSGINQSFETGLAAYLVAETLAAEQLRSGISVIVDAVSPVKESREMWHALSNKHKARLVIIECVLAPGVHRQRIEARFRALHGLAEVTWADVEDRRRKYLSWDEERLVLNTAGMAEENIVKALAYITSAGKIV